MVIQHFNKLIRNKWLWGAFAVAISAFFCFDDVILRDRRSGRETGDAGQLAGEKVDRVEFESFVNDVRGFGQGRDSATPTHEVNRLAWENYAAIKVAEKNGIVATDDEVAAMIRRMPAFQRNGAFSFALYQQLLFSNNITPEQYELSLKHNLTMSHIARSVLGSAAWASPMEIDQAVADMTDVMTVKVATFTQDKAEADAITLDDAGLKKWYEENLKSIEVPECVKIRSVKFDATDPAILAKMDVTENDIHDHYDLTSEKYKTTDTNGVETVKSFEEVKDLVEKEVRQNAAIEFLKTELLNRAYGTTDEATSVSRLDEIAKEDGKTIVTSDAFSLTGAYQEGFMKRLSQILPGAADLASAVSELEPEDPMHRYGVIASKDSVWLIERAELIAKHTPTFEEAKEPIRPRALKAAKADAFKAKIEAIAAKGVEAVLATQNVSTNYVFSVADLKPNSFPDQMTVARAASKLVKGQVSEFTLAGTGRAVLVVCEDRVDGDEAKKIGLRAQVQNDVTMLAVNQIPESWRKWNLERLGFTTSESSYVEAPKSDEE